MPPARRGARSKPAADKENERRLPAQGQGRNKRTPQSAFDPAAQSDNTFEPEAVTAVRKVKDKNGNMIDQFFVKWKGYDAKQSTWEPLDHLAGCEELIANHYEKQKQRNAEIAADDEERRQERQEVMAAQRAQKAAALLEARRKSAVAQAIARPGPAAETPAADTADDEDGVADDDAMAAASDDAWLGNDKKSKKRTAACWQCFSEDAGLEARAVCILPHRKHGGQVCGEIISTKTGTTGMWNHIMYCHQEDFMRYAAARSCLTCPLPAHTSAFVSQVEASH